MGQVSLIFKCLKLIYLLVPLLRMCLLFLLVLLLCEIVFARQLLMESCANPRELKAFGYISSFKSGFDLIFEYDQLHFHFRIYIPFLICWPKAPKRIAYDHALLCFNFSFKNIFSKLQENVLPLEQLGFFLLLHLEIFTLRHCSQGVFDRILSRFRSLFGIGILQD
jgi:hypothetical protein